MLPTHTALVRSLRVGTLLCALLETASVQAKPKAKPAPVATGAAGAAATAEQEKAAAPAPAPPEAVSGSDQRPEPDPEPEYQAPAASSSSAAAPSKPQPKLSAEQLAALRAESSQLVDDITQARAKASLLGKTLFKTQLRLRIQNLAGPDPRLTKAVLKLDGAPVFVGDAAALSGDDAHKVFEGFIAPGQHVLTAELKQQSRKDASFGYSLHDTYNFKAQRDKLSELTLIVDDDSDLADDYADDGDGEYDVRLKLRVRTKNIGEE